MPPETTKPATGSELLDSVEQFVRRFCILPNEHSYAAVTLWAAHTHFIHHMETTGRLACLSPEPGSGKTRVLEVLDVLACNPMLALDLSMSAFFRIVEERRPTILLDEVDAIFTGKAKAEGTEDMRRVINNGYRIGAVVQRVGGQNRDEIQEFRVFTPVAMAGLGNLPDTLMSRSIIIGMKRRAPGERLEPYRDRLHRPEGETIAAQLWEWANESDQLDYPELPDGVEDRDADVWEPLIMVADAAGGSWPERARSACLKFIAEKPASSISLGVRLLSDLRAIWPSDQPTMSTRSILNLLSELDESPWADLYGEGLKPRKLAQLLSGYGAQAKPVRVRDGSTQRGYRREDLWDAWSRYLPQESVTSVTSVTTPESGVDSVTDVTLGPVTGVTHNAPNSADVTDVTDVTLSQGTRGDCVHGIQEGDQPDPWINGKLKCTQCRAAAVA